MKRILLLAGAMALASLFAAPAHAQTTTLPGTINTAQLRAGMAVKPALAGMGAAPSNPYTVTLSWTNGGSCGVTVAGSTSTCVAEVYACQGTCTLATGVWAKIGTTAVGATTFQDTAPSPGGSDSYYVDNIVTGAGWNGAVSGASNVSIVTFPVQAPQALTSSHN